MSRDDVRRFPVRGALFQRCLILARPGFLPNARGPPKKRPRKPDAAAKEPTLSVRSHIRGEALAFSGSNRMRTVMSATAIQPHNNLGAM